MAPLQLQALAAAVACEPLPQSSFARVGARLQRLAVTVSVTGAMGVLASAKSFLVSAMGLSGSE